MIDFTCASPFSGRSLMVRAAHRRELDLSQSQPGAQDSLQDLAHAPGAPYALSSAHPFAIPVSFMPTSTPHLASSVKVDTRCEAMRHVQSTLPKGSTARERQVQARRLTSSPLRQPRGLAMYAVSEPSRFALANTIPQAHDLMFRKASMPVQSSMIANH